MVAKGGTRLINKKSIKILRKKLLTVTLITPNIPEAEILATKKNSKQDMTMLEKNTKTRVKIFYKGGHLKSKISYDILLDKNDIFVLKKKNKIKTYPWYVHYPQQLQHIIVKIIKETCEKAIKYKPQ